MGCTIYPDRLAGIRVETVLGGRLRRVGCLVRRLAVGMEQNIETVSDIEDVRQSREGDSDAYRRLVERHQGHVSKIMWRFSRDFRDRVWVMDRGMV